MFEEPLRTFRAVSVSDPYLFGSVYIWHKETKRDLVAMGSNVPSGKLSVLPGEVN